MGIVNFTVIDNSDEVYRMIQDSEEKVLDQIAKFIGEKMDLYAPVASGYLKSQNEVSVDISNKTITPKNDSDYSGYVEKGTSKMRAQPFITPSVFNHINDITKIIKRGFD